MNFQENPSNRSRDKDEYIHMALHVKCP